MKTPDAIQNRLDALTKPPGSLGKLEQVAKDLCMRQGTLTPQTRPRSAVVFAGDHGCVQSGVSAWPSAVTGIMISNMVSGGAACSALARGLDVAARVSRLLSLGLSHRPQLTAAR